MKFFKLFWLQNKSLICRGEKVTENKLKSFDYGFKIFIPVNVKANFSFAIHQSKTVVMILVNTFDVSSLILATKQWCWAVPHPDVFWYRLNGMGTQKKMRPKSYFNFFPYIFHVKAKKKYSLWILKNKKPFKRHKYHFANALNVK